MDAERKTDKLFTEIHTVIGIRTQLNLHQKIQQKYLKIL